MSETGKTANRRKIIGFYLGPLDLGVGGLLPHHHIWSVIALMCIVVSGGAPAQPACGLGRPAGKAQPKSFGLSRSTAAQRRKKTCVQSYSKNCIPEIL